jgi:uncharacterized membrane protein SirB2
MSSDTVKLSRASAGFGISVAITALFNTVLACVKDAYHPLLVIMNSIAGHNWTTQGLADVILFVGLGLILSRSHAVERIRPDRLIAFLVAAVAVAGVGLFFWYTMF